MRVLFLNFELRLPQGFIIAHIRQVGVKINHQIAGCLVIHLPQAGYKRSGPGIKEAAREADNIIAC